MPIPVPAAFHHTCFLVRDLEGSAQRLADTLNVGPWAVWTIAPEVCRVHGRDQAFSFRVALCTVGGGTLELIAPHSGRAAYDEFLETTGEGCHHVCYAYADMATLRAAKRALVEQGREVIQEGWTEGFFDFAYFSFPEINGVVELLYLDASRLPPPEVVIQPRG